MLMAGTATLPALADINVGFPKSDTWTQSGTTGNENPWSQSPDSGYDIYTNVVGTGEVSTSVNLPKGSFRLSFADTDNIKVFVNGIEVAPTAGGSNAYEFNVQTAGSVAIVIKPARERVQFSFTSQSLELLVNGAAVADALQQDLDVINSAGFKDVDGDDFYGPAEELRAEKPILVKDATYYAEGKTYTDVLDEIRSLDDSGISLARALEIYNEYQLYNTTNDVKTALSSLEGRQKTYNDKVDGENEAWNVYKGNMAKYKELKAGQQSLLSNDLDSEIDVAQLTAEIEAWKVVDEALDDKTLLKNVLNEINAKIVAYGETIDAAFYAPEHQDMALRTAIDFTDRKEFLLGELANLQAQLKQGVSDYDVYYNVNFVLMDKLDEAYNDYISTIYHPEAVERDKEYNNDIYKGIIAGGFLDKIMSESGATDLLNSTKEANQIKNVAGATEYDTKNECTKNIQAAIDQLKADKEYYLNLVKTQDANMVDAQVEIKSMKERLTKFKGYDVPNDAYTEYQNKLAEVEELINELDSFTTEKYDAHLLEIAHGSVYDGKRNEIYVVFNELSILAGPVAIINDLQKMLDDAKAKVAQVSYKAELVGTVDVASKFDGTFDALEKSIKDITNMDEALAAIEMVGGVYVDGCLADEILKTVDNAEYMTSQFVTALEFINAFEHGDQNFGYITGLQQVREIVDRKGIVDATVKYGKPEKQRYPVTVQEVVNAKAAFDFTPYEQAIAAYRMKLADAAAADNQTAWQLIDALVVELQEEMYNWSTTSVFGTNGLMQTAWKDFVVSCTADNRQYAHQLFTVLQGKKAEAEAAFVTHIEDVSFSDVEKALDEADTKQEALTTRTFNLENAAKAVDDLYIKALAAIYVQEDRITELVANQDAFKALTVKIQGLEDNLAGLREYNETTTLTPAKEFFEDKIKDIEDEIDNLAVEIANSVQAESSVEKTPDFNNKIAAIDAKIAETRAADETNNRVHNDQLALEKEVRIYIEDLIAMIKADDNKQGLDVVQDWLDTLNGLLSNDIPAANITVTNAYGTGESAVMNEEITAEYNRIKNEAVEIYNVYADELHKAVVDANAETTGTWPVLMIGLKNRYREGIRLYNYFYYELENAGWREYISEAIRRHQSLFQYYDKINKLNEEGLAAVAAWNAENHVITTEDWNVWLNKYMEMEGDINTDVSAMLNDMNDLAETYYADNKAAAETKISESEAALTAAGIDTKYLDPAKDYLNEAEFEYWRGSKVDVNEDGRTDVSIYMDEIANVLDEIIPAIDVQAYALKAWSEVYAAAQTTIDDLREELNSYEYADATVKANQTKIFNKNVSDATALNNTATTDKNLVNNYKADCEKLHGYLKNMADAVAKVKESNDLNVENKNLYNDFNTWYDGVEADLDALRAYCNAMAGCYGKQGMIDNLESQLAALKQFVETHKSTLTNEDIPDRMAGFDATVLGAYAEAADAEKSFLLRKLDETKVAYNDAYQKHATLPEGKTYDGVNADIREIDGGVAALVFNADDKEAFKTAAVNYEKELADIYTMLQSSWTENPTAAVLAALEGRYNTINATIENGKTYLANCMDEVKAQYPDAYKAVEDALNAERAAWQSEGAYVIDREPFHNSALDKIQKDVNDLVAKISAAEQRAQAEAEKIRVSEARYEVLKAQYDDLVKEFEAAKTTVAGYGDSIAENLTWETNNIQRMLDTALTNLNTARASHSLTASSQLTNGVAIDTAIDSYEKSGATQLATQELNKAVQAGRNASTVLTTKSIVPAERTKLMAEYQTANNTLQSLLDEKNRANVDRLEKIAEEAAALVETFNSIMAGAEENSFILGDVNMDGEPEPNAVDVQTLINFIGEGETYDNLYAADPRQACAADVAANKVLDIADVTALIQMIIGDQPQVLRVKARMQAVTGDDHLNIALIGEEDGVRRYALSLTNTTEFTGAQFDIKASGNARIVGMSSAERTAGHEVYMFENLDGARAVMASMENAVFAGTDGIVMYVDVEGKGELTVSEAIFSDKDNVAHRLDKAHTSHIDAIVDGIKDGASRIYDAAGRAYNSLQKGINIIRHKDGKVTKEMHK